MRTRKLCVVCSKTYRPDITTCPDDGTVLVAEAERELSVGDQLGSYRLVRSLGSGGAGAVFEAEHVRLGRRMAIKVLHPDVVNDEMVVRFFNEARAVNEIRHPNIIDIEDFVTTESGTHYMVMELLEGDDLRTVISREGVLSPERVSTIGQQIASALAAVHRVDIIHRDLKPENIFLVDQNGVETAKLLDFGVAKFTKEEHGVTRAGMTMGTPAYMSPEQITTRGVPGPSSDLYSLGIVLYEALAGAPPFTAISIATVLRAHCMDAPVLPSERRCEPLPAALETTILKCLEKNPANRFSDGDELAAALQANRAVELSTPRRSRPRRRALVEAPVALVAAAMLVLQVAPFADARHEAVAADAAAIRSPQAPTHPVEPPVPAAAPRTTPVTSLVLRSDPPGAKIFIGADRKLLGNAPTQVEIPRSRELVSLVAVFPDGTEIVQQVVPDRPLPAIKFAKPVPAVAKPIAAPSRPPPKRKQTSASKVGRDETVDPFTFK